MPVAYPEGGLKANNSQLLKYLAGSGYFRAVPDEQDPILGGARQPTTQRTPNPFLAALAQSGGGVRNTAPTVGRLGPGNLIDSLATGIYGPGGERLIPNDPSQPPGPVGRGPGYWIFDGWGNVWRNDWDVEGGRPTMIKGEN